MMDKTKVCGLIEDFVAELLYYDCKNNEDRWVGDIAQAIKHKQITITEITEVFKRAIIEGTRQ